MAEKITRDDVGGFIVWLQDNFYVCENIRTQDVFSREIGDIFKVEVRFVYNNRGVFKNLAVRIRVPFLKMWDKYTWADYKKPVTTLDKEFVLAAEHAVSVMRNCLDTYKHVVAAMTDSNPFHQG